MDEVILRPFDGKDIAIANDFVLAMTGYEPDTRFLESIGAKIEPKAKKPILSEEFETTVPGVYVAGTLCAGCDSNAVFVENSREHGALITDHILAKRAGNAAG